MKKIFSIILVLVVLLSCFTLAGCEVDDECDACGGTGYYQKRDCPFC
jgi:hypothetical protein